VHTLWIAVFCSVFPLLFASILSYIISLYSLYLLPYTNILKLCNIANAFYYDDIFSRISSVILERWEGTRVPNTHAMVTAPRGQVLLKWRPIQARNLYTRANHMVIQSHYQTLNLYTDFKIYFWAFINSRHCLEIQNYHNQDSLCSVIRKEADVWKNLWIYS
jgi:hypothetical protein